MGLLVGVEGRRGYRQSGFTITEVVVTITLVVVFVALFVQAIMYLSSSNSRQGRESIAIGVSISNLSKYNTEQAIPDSFSCSEHSSKADALTVLDNSAPNKEDVPSGNWGTFDQEVIMYAKNGCGKPVTVESTVRYGHADSIREVSQVSYAL